VLFIVYFTCSFSLRFSPYCSKMAVVCINNEFFWCWIRNWSHIASHLVLVLLVLVGANSSKKPRAPSLQIGLGWNIAGLTLSGFWYDVILSGWRSWRPSAARCCIRSCVRRLPASQSSACDVIGSLCALQFLIRSTFVLVVVCLTRKINSGLLGVSLSYYATLSTLIGGRDKIPNILDV